MGGVTRCCASPPVWPSPLPSVSSLEGDADGASGGGDGPAWEGGGASVLTGNETHSRCLAVCTSSSSAAVCNAAVRAAAAAANRPGTFSGVGELKPGVGGAAGGGGGGGTVVEWMSDGTHAGSTSGTASAAAKAPSTDIVGSESNRSTPNSTPPLAAGSTACTEGVAEGVAASSTAEMAAVRPTPIVLLLIALTGGLCSTSTSPPPPPLPPPPLLLGSKSGAADPHDTLTAAASAATAAAAAADAVRSPWSKLAASDDLDGGGVDDGEGTTSTDESGSSRIDVPAAAILPPACTPPTPSCAPSRAVTFGRGVRAASRESMSSTPRLSSVTAANAEWVCAAARAPAAIRAGAFRSMPIACSWRGVAAPGATGCSSSWGSGRCSA